MNRFKPFLAPSDPPLADTLRLMMPSARTTLLLQAALLKGDVVGEAWAQWRQIVPDPKAFLASDRIGIKRHLPLLYRNLTAHDVELTRDIEPYFRAARAREELRSVRYRKFLGEAIGALQSNGVDFVVGKGVTVGETIHTDPVVRHSHDIDLLVRSEDLAAAATALQAAGFAESTKRGVRGEPKFDHESGLPVELHDSLYRTPFYDGNLNGIWSSARAGEILGWPVQLISDEDIWVHALVHASVVPQRWGLSWIVDVMSLLHERSTQGRGIDWRVVMRAGEEARATLPLYVMCQYLAATFEASVPRHVLDELRRFAGRAKPLEKLAALDGVRAEVRTRRFKVIVGASGWRSRAAIARTMLLPPPAYLKHWYPGVGIGRLPFLYVTRPLRFIGRQIGRIRYRLPQSWFRSAPVHAGHAMLVSNAGGPQLSANTSTEGSR